MGQVERRHGFRSTNKVRLIAWLLLLGIGTWPRSKRLVEAFEASFVEVGVLEKQPKVCWRTRELVTLVRSTGFPIIWRIGP